MSAGILVGRGVVLGLGLALKTVLNGSGDGTAVRGGSDCDNCGWLWLSPACQQRTNTISHREE